MATQKKTQAAAPQAPAPAATPKSKLKFKANEFVVYPAHGVGKIVDIEEQEIAGAKLELYVIDFLKEKMRLRVPTAKAESVGMRKLADKNLVEQAMKVLKGRAKIKRTIPKLGFDTPVRVCDSCNSILEQKVCDYFCLCIFFSFTCSTTYMHL